MRRGLAIDLRQTRHSEAYIATVYMRPILTEKEIPRRRIGGIVVGRRFTRYRRIRSRESSDPRRQRYRSNSTQAFALVSVALTVVQLAVVSRSQGR